MVDGIGDGTSLETLEPEVMADLLRKSDLKIYKSGRDSSLTESQSGPSTDTSDVKVASLLMTFQDQSPAPPSPSPPPAAQKIDPSHTSELRGTPRPTIPGNSSVTSQRVLTERKHSLQPEHDDSPTPTLQDLDDCVPPDRGQSAGHKYYEVSSGSEGLLPSQPTEPSEAMVVRISLVVWPA
ncbi:hypothetical protein BGY98DRAFT_988758 [Russula aff. rugulosa BPL654]|nr:hypothetical protein BGY98DRAFT_988758 [Russula aff. rugulosa BPL654]